MYRNNANAEYDRDRDRERLIPFSSAIVPSDYGSFSGEPETGNMADVIKSGAPSRKAPQYFAALAATTGAVAAGTVLGWTSPTESLIVTPADNASFIGEYGFPVNDEEWSWIGSSMTLGAAAMCLFIGSIINMIGRKLTMLLLIIPFTIGWVLVIWATNTPMLYIGRIFLGISGGSFCVTSPIYTGEIAEKEIRGTLGSYFQLMLTVGILFVYAIGHGLNVFTISIICGVIPLIFGIIFVFMPESPYYWISKNRTDDAVKSLIWLRGKQYDYNAELSDLQAQHEELKANKVSIGVAFARKSTIKGLFISLGLMFFQQMSGINAVIFYTGFIFNAASTDGGGINGSIATIIVGVMQVIATFVSSIVVDKLGRRILLLASAGVMCICTILLGVFFFLRDQDQSSVENLGWLPIVSLCVFIVMFSMGFGPIPWMILGELFASDVKGIAGSLAGAFNWILAFIITKTFTNIRDGIGLGQTFWLFSGFSLLGVIFIFFIVPETKGKSLIDIQKMLSGEKITKELDNETNNDAKL